MADPTHCAKGEAYQRYGDRDGFVEPSSYEFQTVAQGTATHVVAAFSPDIAGKCSKIVLELTSEIYVPSQITMDLT